MGEARGCVIPAADTDASENELGSKGSGLGGNDRSCRRRGQVELRSKVRFFLGPSLLVGYGCSNW
jgi:hypothetical protein